MMSKQLIGYVFLMMLFFGLQNIANAGQVGQIIKLRGKADVSTPGKKPIRLRLGAQIYENDIIRTKRRTQLKLLMHDGTKITLGEKTRIVVSQYVTKGEPKGRFNLLRGRMRAFVSGVFSKRRNSFRMRTSTAVIGVQGTDFSVISEDISTKVLVYHGEVMVRNINPQIRAVRHLRRNQSTTVLKDQAPSKPFNHVTDENKTTLLQKIQKQKIEDHGPGQINSNRVNSVRLPPIPNTPPK